MENFTQAISHILGMSIVHSLWQGLLIFLLLKIILVCFPSISAAKKHNLSLAALFTLTGWFIFTINDEANTVKPLVYAGNSVVFPTVSESGPILSVNDAAYPYIHVIDDYLPYITLVYLIGLLFQLVKLGFTWNAIRRIRGSLSPVPNSIAELVKQLTTKFGIKKQVAVMHSRLVNVPGIIGYARPLILLPFSFTCNLSTDEAETILLHELAHVKRNDFVVNLIQRFIGIILFFNPFVQLINTIIEGERENSCDDLVVKVTNNPLLYAHALLKLEQTDNGHLSLALAAKSKKYRLLTRIDRIMKAEKLTISARNLLFVVLLSIGSIGSVAWISPLFNNGAISKGEENDSSIDESLALHKKLQVNQSSATAEGTSSAVKNPDPAISSNGYFDPALEKMYKQARLHVKNLEGVLKSPRYGSPEIIADMVAVEAQLKKAGFRYTPEFQKRADSITTEFDGYPLVKREYIFMHDRLNQLALYLSNPEYQQKIQKMSVAEYKKYLNYMKKFENL
ncbi:M56 family metallopeptidase [Pedobacter metabolipauper]|uniref:Beta-lactamase regulating signal transducer with metallopeptidase domain n=1 Tax=Pedobacter metabolipauper TaxID=425513 RepID=A0A4R6T2W2_9SPHI|nr:M56 family metallopeptidase [Pedobacter metabolipauper]TDQ12068.1 beta-lactamase regulating signal transducer with metallopeptidase domain [Pedobacter metabolipauper]